MNEKMTAEKAIEQLNSLMNDRENHVHRDDFDDIFLHCPACGNDFHIEDLGQTMYYSICPDCGQALDWSDENE